MYRELLELAPDAIVVTDSMGYMVMVNRETERVFGYARDEMLGQYVEILLPKRFREVHVGYRGGYAACPRTRQMGFGLSLFGRSKDGSEFPIDVSLSPLGRGQDFLVMAVIRDVTERKRMEDEIRLLQTITLAVSEAEDLDSALGIVLRQVCRTTGWTLGEAWVPCSDGTCLERSSAWYSNTESLAGFRNASEKFTFAPGRGLPGRVWSSKQPAWIRDVTLDSDFPRAAIAREAGLKAAMAIPILAGDDLVAVIDFFVPEPREEDGRLVKLISAVAAQFGTVIQRKRAEQDVRKLNEELERRVLERTAELEAFSYSVSHDLRAPLRAMDGFSRILIEKHAPKLDPEAQRLLNIVRESTQEMGNLIDALLTFSRLGRQPVKKQVVAPAELAREALQDLQPAQQRRRVEVSIGHMPFAQADPILLKQVYVNLLSNALKFTQGRDLARIEIGYQEMRDERIYFVKDNGVGFDMRYADKLFGVFQRLHQAKEYEGTGVGLAIVQRVIQRHGGRVWVKAVPDQGATFYFTLPGGDFDPRATGRNPIS